MAAVVRLQKQVAQPIHSLFRFLQQKVRVEVWLFEQTHTRLEGVILGFDEYMNLVLDAVEEVTKNKRGGASKRKPLGRLLLKGDNICAVCQAGAVVSVGIGAGAGAGAGSAVVAAVAVAAAAIVVEGAGVKRSGRPEEAQGGEGGGEGDASGPSTKRARHDDAPA